MSRELQSLSETESDVSGNLEDGHGRKFGRDL